MPSISKKFKPSVQSALSWAISILKKSADHRDSAGLDAELLLALVLKASREYLYAHPEQLLKLSELKTYKNLVARRSKHEPIAYIICEKEFFGLTFNVNSHVLIPRPGTELLAEEAILGYRVKSLGFRNILDVGTGSGAIAVSLAKYLPKAKIIATDISVAALKVAKQNARRHGVSGRIKFIKTDLLPQLSTFNSQLSTLIVANLPYLPARLYAHAAPEIKKYEPKSAFIGGGADGLNIIRALLMQIKKQGLRGVTLLEIDPSQQNKLSSFAKKHFPGSSFEVKKDLAGKARLFCLKLV